jgi:hypothetical protein
MTAGQDARVRTLACSECGELIGSKPYEWPRDFSPRHSRCAARVSQAFDLSSCRSVGWNLAHEEWYGVYRHGIGAIVTVTGGDRMLRAIGAGHIVPRAMTSQWLARAVRHYTDGPCTA